MNKYSKDSMWDDQANFEAVKRVSQLTIKELADYFKEIAQKPSISVEDMIKADEADLPPEPDELNAGGDWPDKVTLELADKWLLRGFK